MSYLSLTPKARGLALTGLLAAGLGLLVADRPARACECVTPRWNFALRSVTGGAGSPNHGAYWPSTVNMTSHPGRVTLTAGRGGGSRIDLVEGSTR